MTQPTIHYRSEIPTQFQDDTHFHKALKFFKGYGRIPDPHQEIILRDWLTLDSRNGKWLHTTNGVSLSRQNGKSESLELRMIYGLIALKEQQIYTSLELRSAEEIYSRLVSFFDDDRYPEIKALVKRISRTNGKSFILLNNGARVSFIARSKGSGRGFSADLLIADEAMELSSQSYSALQPTTSARPNAQTILTGSPPYPGSEAEVFAKFRQSALDKKGERHSWIEYSATQGDDYGDEDLWWQVVPALASGRISIETVRSEYATFPEEVFARERLGTWISGTGQSPIDAEKWTALYDEHSKIDSGHVLAIDMSPARSSATLAVAGHTAPDAQGNTKIHIETIDHRIGVNWILAKTIDVAQRNGIKSVVLDGGGPAASLADDLRAAKLKVIIMTTQNVKDACGLFVDAVDDQSMVHISQPTLNTAVANARKRKIQDAFAWSRSIPTADITPLVATTYAAWGARSSNKKVRKARTQLTNTKRKALIL